MSQILGDRLAGSRRDAEVTADHAPDPARVVRWTGAVEPELLAHLLDLLERRARPGALLREARRGVARSQQNERVGQHRRQEQDEHQVGHLANDPVARSPQPHHPAHRCSVTLARSKSYSVTGTANPFTLERTAQKRGR